MLIKSQGVYILVDMPCTIFSQNLVTSTMISHVMGQRLGVG